MSAMHPCATVWDALEHGGYGPRGQSHDFRSRCPAHDGENPSSLHVSIGADGRALLRCHAHGCAIEQIVGPIGLAVHDLFPAGHRNGRRRQLKQASRSDFTGNARTFANILKASEALGERWRGELVVDCPYCGIPNARLVVPSDPEHKPFVHCEAGCTARMFTEALAGRLQDRMEAG